MAELPVPLEEAVGGGWELTTVADDEAVFHRGTEVERVAGLAPGRGYERHGQAFATLPRPGGRLLCTVATVNDVHFGEVMAGHVEGMDISPVLSSAPGEVPYPEMMNRAAVAEIAALEPAAVLAKGDLTAGGLPQEYAAFEACYRPAFGDRLHVTRGNHDNRLAHVAFACPAMEEVRVPGAVLALLDTSRPGEGGGSISDEQFEWLDALAQGDGPPVLVFAHHPAWQDHPTDWVGEGASLDPASSAALVAVAARRRRVAGYFAGHTHRNRTRYFPEAPGVPFTEVACVKDFPGSWAEYRIFEGGILQVHRRLSSAAALAWSERCRAMVFGLYPRYAMGTLSDRCFALPPPCG